MASDPVQLVITIFARRPAACEPFFVNGQARPLEQKGPAMREQIFTLHITELLISILGHADVKLQQSKRLSRNVSQSKFLLSGELIRGLPGSKPCDIQHHQAISWFEKQHSVEVLVDDYPPPPLSLAKGVGDELRRPIKLAVFDMDSTLIDQEVIDELARSIGVEPAVSAITHRAMNGELDFAQSLIARVALLAGVKANVWEDLKKTITIASGAKELCQRLREQGVKSAVISGGFEPMAKWLQGQLGLDYAFANQLSMTAPSTDGDLPTLTGTLVPDRPIVTPQFKRDKLVELAKDLGVPLEQTLAVGDGANDLPMLHTAGLGIAWRAKQKVQDEAPHRLNGESLTDILLLVQGP